MKNTPPKPFTKMLINSLSSLSKFENKFRKKDRYVGELGFFPFLRDLVITFSQGMNGTFKRIYTTYPETAEPVAFYVGNIKCVLLRDPSHISTILRNKEQYDWNGMPMAMNRFREALGLSLITVEKPQWKDMRDRTVVNLTGKQLNKYEAIMKQVMEEEMLPSWREHARTGQPINLWESMLKYSSRVVFMAFLGLGKDEVPNDVHMLLNEMFNQMRHFLLAAVAAPLWVPTPTNVKFNSHMKKVRDFIRPYITPERAKENTMFASIIRSHTERKDVPYDDFIQHLKSMIKSGELVEAADAKVYYYEHKKEDVTRLVKTTLSKLSGLEFDREPELVQTEMESYLCQNGKVNEELVLQETISNLIGGSETTIVLMVFTTYFLANNQDVQEKLRNYLKEAKEKQIPVEQQLKEGYLGQVLNETLRLTPPGFSAYRALNGDVTLPDGTVITKDYVTWMAPYYIHHDKRYWKDAEKFDPDRWASNAPMPKEGSYVPFGIGQRACPGNLYAKREAAISVTALVENFIVEMADPNYQLFMDVNITMRPRDYVNLKLTEIS